MKEVIIRYKDSKVLELLKTLSGFLDFSVIENQNSGRVKKNVSFTVFQVDEADAEACRFKHGEANER